MIPFHNCKVTVVVINTGANMMTTVEESRKAKVTGEGGDFSWRRSPECLRYQLLCMIFFCHVQFRVHSGNKVWDFLTALAELLFSLFILDRKSDF